MGILMRHPDVEVLAEAVGETQAALREQYGWVRLTDEEAAEAGRQAAAAEHASMFSLPSVDASSSDDLNAWTVPELHQLAEARNVPFKAHDTKAELIAAIEAGPTPTEA